MDNTGDDSDLLDELVLEFPRIFGSGRPPNSHLPAGWLALVRGMLADIEGQLAPERAVKVQQVKEKFGGMRFYWSLGAERTLIADIYLPQGRRRLNLKPEEPSEAFKAIDARVRQAEEASLEICDQCGRPGKLIRQGWWRVRCGGCSKDE